MTNFSRKEMKRTIIKSILWLLVFCFLIIIAVNIKPTFNIYKSAKRIYSNISILPEQFNSENIKNTKTIVQELKTDSKNLRKNISDIKIVNFLPIINNTINSTDTLLEIAVLLTDSYDKLYPILEENITTFSNSTDTKLISLPNEAKLKLINSISKSQEAISNLQINLTKSINLINKHNNSKEKSITPIEKVWKKINENYQAITIANRFLPIIKTLPEILGVENESKYLLLFQNNTEIRATGGFIGTYGTVNIKNGEIGDVFTDNIYNLDNAAAKRVVITPPKYLVDYLHVKNLYMRDANYNPDFEESAKYIIELYKQESLNKYPITGVIAITPDVLENVIGYFGEISAMDVTFTKENAIDLLNYETKFGYWQDRNIPASQRKVIIQKLADVLFDKIKDLSLSDMKDFFAVISKDLDKKNILMYFSNPEIQNFIASNKWGGKMLDNQDSDYISIVDTNTLSGKAEPYIDKNIAYSLDVVNNELIATLDLTYTHRYDDYLANDIYQDDPGYLQQYKSYTRVYVPMGSWLISLQKDNGPASRENIDFKDENKKTSFGFYLTINKNTTSTYRLIYKLPKELSEKLINKYSLIYQKQSGGYKNHLNFRINLNKSIKDYLLDTNNDTNKMNITRTSKEFILDCFSDTDKEINIKYETNTKIDYIKDFLKISS